MNAETDSLSKIAYVAKRNPALDHEQFIRRWRQHGALAMGLAQWHTIVRYAHCDTLAPDGSPAPCVGFDGIGMTWVSKSFDRWPEDATYEDDQALLRRDELETFSANCVEFMMALRQYTIKFGYGPVKMNVFVTRESHVSHADFDDFWLNRHSQAVVTDPRSIEFVRRYVQNRVVNDEFESRLGFDGVSEYWFDSVDDANRYFSDAPSDDFDPRFINPERTLKILTNEVVLYDFAQ